MKKSLELPDCLDSSTILIYFNQGVLGGGTTWHSSGLISLMKPSFVETKLTKISKDLYLELQNEHGYYTGWKQVRIDEQNFYSNERIRSLVTF